MTLDIKRIREMWWLFGYVLPLDTETHKEAIKLALGHGLEEIIPDLMIVVSQYAERNPEDFEMYCEFVVEALQYMRGETNKHPVTDTPRKEYEREMLFNLGRYTKSEKRKVQAKYEKLQQEAPQTTLEGRRDDETSE